jgi:hypothetical protein
MTVSSNSGDRAGYTFGSDDIGSGVQVPYSKLLDPTPGSSAGIGNAANPMQMVTDLVLAMSVALERIANPPWVDPVSGRVRVLIDALGGAQTLGTVSNITTLPTLAAVTTVATVTNLAQIGALQANGFIYDQMHNAYVNSMRGCYS